MQTRMRRLWGIACVWTLAATVAMAADRKEPKKGVREAARTKQKSVTMLPGGDVSFADELTSLPVKATFYRDAAGAGGAVTAAAGLTGACCQDNRSCTVVTQAECEQAGGLYRGNATVCSPDQCPSLVFQNDLGVKIFGPNPGRRIADDITTVSVAGCNLDTFVFRVAGDKNNDPTTLAGSFTVDYALYRTCPSADQFPFPIGGTSGTVTLHPKCVGGTNDGLDCASDADCSGGTCDDVLHEVVVQIPPATNIALPRTVYLALTFSGHCFGGSSDGATCMSNDDCPGGTCGATAGAVVGGLPRLGFSTNRFDDPNAPCSASFNIFPPGPHASFDADVYARGDCTDSKGARAFVGYKSSKQSQGGFTTGASTLFAEDIRLPVASCKMVAYEIAFKGDQFSSAGAVEVKFHDKNLLNGIDPENDGFIAGTRRQFQVTGSTVQVLRAEFDPPIDLPEGGNPLLPPFFVKFETSSAVIGPIATCRQADLGTTDDSYRFWAGSRPPSNPPSSEDEWRLGDIPDCFSAFDIAIYCQGDPPQGACCDVILTEDNVCSGGPNSGQPCGTDDDCACPGGDPTCIPGECVGDAVCREVGRMNCASETLDLWVQDGRCGPVCQGGSNDGLPCAGPGDCPSVCVGGTNNGQPCPNGDADCTGGGACDSGLCEGSFCAGGPNDTQPCTRQADCSPLCNGGSNHRKPCINDGDCPGGVCDVSGACEGQPFLNQQACGTAACCTGDPVTGQAVCDDLTEKECFFKGNPDDPRMFQLGKACNIGGQACPIPACLSRTGECTVEQPGVCSNPGDPTDGQPCDRNATIFNPDDCMLAGGFCEGKPGCADPFCCTAVCCGCDPLCQNPPLALAQCCTQHWGPQCVNEVFSCPGDDEFIACGRRKPANDECFDAEIAGNGALLIPTDATLAADSNTATENPNDPGFCCHLEDPGAPGVGTTWFKFVATDPVLNVQTCLSTSGGDSLIQMFAVPDQNRGICENLEPCDLSAPSCADGSTCVFDERFACDNLIPIACNDDGGDTCSLSNPERSRLCVRDLVPGNLYYIMVASKSADRCVGGPKDGQECERPEDCGPICNGGITPNSICTVDADCQGGFCDFSGICQDLQTVYKLQLTPNCTAGDPLLPNDLCPNATVINDVVPDPFNVTMPFDLSGTPMDVCLGGTNHGLPCTGSAECPGGTCDTDTNAAATFDCPGPSQCTTMDNDIWYEWTAPATGLAEFKTCGADNPSTPHTTLAVYQGCGCPVDPLAELDCNETGNPSDCFLGSIINLQVVKDTCYKIRLGGRAGDTPAGNLSIRLTACSDLPVTFVDPPAGTVDARQLHPPLDPSTKQSIQAFIVTSADDIRSPGCWGLCESGIDLFANFITSISNNFCTGGDNDGLPCATQLDCPGGGTCNPVAGQFAVKLARPITPGAVTTITYKHGDGSFSVGDVSSQPGNVDAGPLAEASDVSALISYVNGASSPFGKYSEDLDHSGRLAPPDILRLLDLLGGGADFAAWLGTALPDCGPCTVCTGGPNPGKLCVSDEECDPGAGGACVCP